MGRGAITITTTQFRTTADSDVLISVGVVGLESAEQIATTVLQMVTDRIT